MYTYICIWRRYLQKHLGLKGKKVDDWGIKKGVFTVYFFSFGILDYENK